MKTKRFNEMATLPILLAVAGGAALYADPVMPLHPSCSVSSAKDCNLVANPDFTPNKPWAIPVGGPIPVNPWSGSIYYNPNFDPYGNHVSVDGWVFGPNESSANGYTGSGVAEQGSGFNFTAAPDGAQQVAFIQAYLGGTPPVSSAGTISLQLGLTGLTAGDKYQLSFYLEPETSFYSGGNPITVQLNGLGFLSTTPQGTVANNAWTLYYAYFVATSGSANLGFLAYPGTVPGKYTDGLSEVQVFDVTQTPPVGLPPGNSLTFLPEGGSSTLYLLLAGGVCIGAIFLSSKERQGLRAEA